MNIFKSVKEAVSTVDAASFYGIKVNRSGLCNCPFHNDRTPSMKVDIRYYCFGCGAKGDVVDFVSRLYGLSPFDAARKIASDFNVIVDDYFCDKRYKNYSSGNCSSHIPSRATNPLILQKNNEYQLKRALVLYVRDALFSLHKYREKLLTYKTKYAPSSIEELDTCHPFFEEALKNLGKIDWMIDELTFGSRDEQITFLNNYKGEIEHVKSRLTEIN